MKKNIRLNDYKTLLLQNGRIVLGKKVPLIKAKIKRDEEMKICIVFGSAFRIYDFNFEGLRRTREVVEEKEVFCKEKLWRINIEQQDKNDFFKPKGSNIFMRKLHLNKNVSYAELKLSHEENIQYIRRMYS